MEIIDEEIKGLLNEMMQHDLEPYWECGSRPLHDLWSLARARTGLKLQLTYKNNDILEKRAFSWQLML